MAYTNNSSLSSSNISNSPKHHVNWHEAVTCAVRIELRDYANLLEFESEYILGKNNYRIDLLIIKRVSKQPIPKNIARCFQTYNLFEIKGLHSSLTINAYYKTIGYAGLFINQLNRAAQFTCPDISITFLTFRYPRKLIKYLREKRNLTVAKSSPGIYDINKETFKIQIIVTCRLPPEENLYLHCLTDKLQNASLINRLVDDYSKHKDDDTYTRYLHQLMTANIKPKGESPMVCEGLFNLFGTSSAEIIEHAKKEWDAYYLPKIDELSSSNKQLSSSNKQLFSSNQKLSAQIDYLKNLLRQNNISFELNTEAGGCPGNDLSGLSCFSLCHDNLTND